MSVLSKLFGRNAPQEPTVTIPEIFSAHPLRDDELGGLCEATDGIDCTASATQKFTAVFRIERGDTVVGRYASGVKACDKCTAVNCAGCEDDLFYWRARGK